jgi:hypothetical protein
MERTPEHDEADRLAELRWPGGFVCVCGSPRHYRLHKRPRVFACQQCGKQTSVTAGTLLHGAHLPIRAWFEAAELMSRAQSVTAAELERRLEVHYETAWQLLQRLRGGLRHDGPRLVAGALQLGHTFVTYRPPATAPATRLGHGVWVLLDERGSIAVDTAWAPFSLGERIRRGETFTVPAAQRRQLRGAAADLARAIRHRWMHIHRAISERWATRYAAEWEATRGRRAIHASHIVTRAIQHSNQPFDEFRPRWAKPPRPRSRSRPDLLRAHGW